MDLTRRCSMGEAARRTAPEMLHLIIASLRM
jgi:hypothetical protein